VSDATEWLDDLADMGLPVQDVAPVSQRPIIATPQEGPQKAMITSPVYEVLFGGARGGGKTYGALLDWVYHSDRLGKKASGIIFRRTYDELDEVVKTAANLYVPLGARHLVGARSFEFPNGAILKYRFLEKDSDADRYQGHQYTWICFDEVTNWANPAPLNKLRACLRGPIDPRQFRLLCTGNPGGPGHNWVKARYIDAAPPYVPHGTPGKRIVFIPSLYKDNPALALNDPGYLDRITEDVPEWLAKAWVDGDWNIVAGGMFDDVWDTTTPHATMDEKPWGFGNICQPFVIPHSWSIKRSFDWGSSRPFSVGWWAVSDGTWAKAPGERTVIVPAGTMFRIHEWYGSTGEPDVGLKLLATEVAEEIIEIERDLTKKGGIAPGHKIKAGPADAAIYAAENGVCIADDMRKNGVTWLPADKSPGSRVNGWERMRQMFKAAGQPVIENPALIVFNTCRDFIRTVPVLPRDKKKIDDVDTSVEDHIGDETRYAVMKPARKLSKVRTRT